MSANRFLGASIAAIVAAAVPSAAYAQQQNYSFDLPSEKLGDSLRAIGARAGTSIAFDPALVRGKRAPAIKGEMGIGEALSRGLAGSGLEVRPSGNGYIVAAQAELGNAGAAGKAAASLGEGIEPTDQNQAIVVTGSHIRGVPTISKVKTLSGDEMIAEGYSRLDQALQQLPENFAGGAAASSNGSFGVGTDSTTNTTFASSVNLFGLGAGTTLILLNGQRLAPTGSGTMVDISGLPISAIDRVEIVEDGASAIYGADAVGGVVNVITKKDFDGVEAGVRLTGIADAKHPDPGANVLAGKTWGSGGILLDYDLEHDSPLMGQDRSFTSGLLRPLYLTPRQRNSRLYASVHQDLSPDFTISGQFFFPYRSFQQLQQNARLGLEQNNGWVRQLAGSVEADYHFMPGWTATLDAAYARDSSENTVSESAINFLDHTGERFTSPSIEAKVDGPIAHIGGGEIRLAAGASYRDESLSQFDFTRNTSSNHRRQVGSAYAEVYLPIVGSLNELPGVKEFTIDVAGRYDHYSDFGSSANPRVGALWKPFEDLTLKGTYARSFKAPEFIELYLAKTAYIISAPDSQSPTGRSIGIITDGGNPELGPEKSRSYTLNMRYHPHQLPGLEVNVGYFNIHYRNRISRLLLDGFFTNALALADELGPFVVRSPSASEIAAATAPGTNVVSTVGAWNPSMIQYLATLGYQNTSVSMVSGITSDLSYSTHAVGGKVKLAIDTNWYLKSKNQFTPGTTPFSILNNAGQPLRFRAKLTAAWQSKAWSSYLRLNYSNPYHNTAVAPCSTTPGGCPVSSWAILDLGVAYQTKDEPGILGGIRIAADVGNLLNTDPPFTQTGHIDSLPYDPINANPLGRVVSLSVIKRW